jgi:hypothetical protein
MKKLLLVLLIVSFGLPAMAQWILHPVKPLEHTNTEIAGFITLDGMTMFTAQYRMGFSATSDAAVTLSYGSEDPVSAFEIGLDYNIFMPNILPPKVLFSINPSVNYYSAGSESFGVDVNSSSLGLGCWALLGYEVMPKFVTYGGLSLFYYSMSVSVGNVDESDSDTDVDIGIGGLFDLNDKVKLQAELSNMLDDVNITLGARYGL